MTEQQTPEEQTETPEEQSPGDAWSKEIVVGEPGDAPEEPEPEVESTRESRRHR